MWKVTGSEYFPKAPHDSIHVFQYIRSHLQTPSITSIQSWTWGERPPVMFPFQPGQPPTGLYDCLPGPLTAPLNKTEVCSDVEIPSCPLPHPDLESFWHLVQNDLWPKTRAPAFMNRSQRGQPAQGLRCLHPTRPLLTKTLSYNSSCKQNTDHLSTIQQTINPKHSSPKTLFANIQN